MNSNQIKQNHWSNPASESLYRALADGTSPLALQYQAGAQCGGCSFFAPLNADWGLCCHAGGEHHLETVFEHFTCGSYVAEGWGPHSFTEDKSYHCRCGGEALTDEQLR